MEALGRSEVNREAHALIAEAKRFADRLQQFCDDMVDCDKGAATAIRAAGLTPPDRHIPWGRWTFSGFESDAEGLIWALDAFVELAGVNLPPLPVASEPGQPAPTAVPDLVVHTPPDDPTSPVEARPPEPPPTEGLVDWTGRPFVSGVMTEEKLAVLLGSSSGRRKEFESKPPKEQAAERTRLAQMLALRASPMPGDLDRVRTLARELQGEMQGIVDRYAPLEVERVLKAAGLYEPSDIPSWDAEAFSEAHSRCRKLAGKLDKFLDVTHDTVLCLVPQPPRRRADAA
jgi:hypothetical protein